MTWFLTNQKKELGSLLKQAFENQEQENWLTRINQYLKFLFPKHKDGFKYDNNIVLWGSIKNML